MTTDCPSCGSESLTTDRRSCYDCGWTSDRLVLPSGSTIDADTADAIRALGEWRGMLDPRTYQPADQRALDDHVGKPE